MFNKSVITIGDTLSRIKASEGQGIKLSYLSIQNISEFIEGKEVLKESYNLNEIRSDLNVEPTKAHEGDVILSLQKINAIYISKDLEGLYIYSNFVIIKTGEDLDAMYLTYLFNEDNDFKNSLRKKCNATSLFANLKATDLKLFKWDLPTIKEQRLIGRCYIKNLELHKEMNRLKKLQFKKLNHYNNMKKSKKEKNNE